MASKPLDIFRWKGRAKSTYPQSAHIFDAATVAARISNSLQVRRIQVALGLLADRKRAGLTQRGSHSHPYISVATPQYFVQEVAELPADHGVAGQREVDGVGPKGCGSTLFMCPQDNIYTAVKETLGPVARGDSIKYLSIRKIVVKRVNKMLSLLRAA